MTRIPVVDLLEEPSAHQPAGPLGFPGHPILEEGYMGTQAVVDSPADCEVLHPAQQPGLLQHPLDELALLIAGGSIVKVRCGSGHAGTAGPSDLDEVEPLADDTRAFVPVSDLL